MRISPHHFESHPFGWISPTIAANGLASAAAASDTPHHLRFVQDAEAHRRYIQRTLNDFIRLNPDKDGAVVQGDSALWQSILKFDYRFPPLLSANSSGLQNVAQGALQSVIALMVFAALTAMLLALSLRRLQSEAL